MKKSDIDGIREFSINQIGIYTPEFKIESIEFIRIDTSSYIFEITGDMQSDKAITLNWFSVNIYANVKNKIVEKYTVLIPEWLIEKNLFIKQPF